MRRFASESAARPLTDAKFCRRFPTLMPRGRCARILPPLVGARRTGGVRWDSPSSLPRGCFQRNFQARRLVGRVEPPHSTRVSFWSSRAVLL